MLCVGVLLQLLLLPLLGDVIRHHPLMRQRSGRALTSAIRRASLAHAGRFQTAPRHRNIWSFIKMEQQQQQQPSPLPSFYGHYTGQRSVVHGSTLCDPIQPNPLADRPNPLEVRKFGPNPIQLTVIG